MKRWHLVVVPILCGVLGFTFAWGAWHLWNDHWTLHVLDSVVAQHQQVLQRFAKPPATPSPQSAPPQSPAPDGG